MQNYLTEAKRAAEGSESKEKLLEAVENLANALREVQDARGMDFDVMKRDLNAYRRYCDRAAELLEVTEEKAPGATKALWRGLPIIDKKIKEPLREIKKKSKGICETAEIPEAELACKIEKHAADAIATDNPVIILRIINYILNDFELWGHSIKDPNEKEYIEKIINEAKNEDLPGQLWQIRVLIARLLEFSGGKENRVPYSSELESEISHIFKSVYQKECEKGESDVNSKTLMFLKTKLHDLAAAKRPFKWLDVGCGYGRALDVLDTVNVPRDMFKYQGIDAVYKYLDEAEEQAKKYNLVHYTIEKLDAAQIKFDSEFDLISAVLLLHEVDPWCLPYIVGNMIRALKPEGTLVISDFQGPYEQEEGIVAWSADDIERLLERTLINIRF